MAKRLVLSVVLAALLSLTALSAAAQPQDQNETEVDVTSQNLDGTTIGTYVPSDEDTAAVTFTEGPGAAPLGSGSLEMTVGSNPAAGGQIQFTNYAGTNLSELTELSFWTYVQGPDTTAAPYMALYVDGDGNGEFELVANGEDFILFYDPWEQTGQDLALNTWQEWDTLADGNVWRQYIPEDFPSPTNSMSHYIDENPNASIFGQGVRVFAGFWGVPDFVGNTDAVSIGVNDTTTVYDLEPVITVCVDQGTGHFRFVEDAEQCESSESVEHWDHGDSQGEQITACTSDITGNTRIVPDPSECRDSEEVTQWARGTGEGPQITACAKDINTRSRRGQMARIVDDPADCHSSEIVVQWDDPYPEEEDDDSDGRTRRRGDDDSDNGDSGETDGDSDEGGSRSRR